jgi:hypothetical protein
MILARVAEGKFRELRTDEDLLPHGRTSTSRRRRPSRGAPRDRRRGAAACRAGATVIRKHNEAWGPWPDYHYVMADPKGNVFCVQ